MAPADRDEAKRVGQRIRELRDAAGLTNEELAQEVGLSAAAVKAWGSGNGLSGFLKLKRLAEKLGTTPNVVLCVAEAGQAPAPPSHQALLASVEGALRLIGLDPEATSRLTELVQECANEPLSPGSSDPLEIRRHIAESAVRRFLKQEAGRS